MLQQQHHGGVKQNGGLVEDVLQGHQAHAGAKRQAAAVEVVGLHRHGTGTQTDDVAEGAHERRFQRLPHGEAGHPAADDDPADQTFQHRVGQAHGQHEQYLPEAQLCQRGRDLGPVALEDPEDDAGEHHQNGEREDRFLRDGCCGVDWSIREGSFRDRWLQYTTAAGAVCELVRNFSRQFEQSDKKSSVQLSVSLTLDSSPGRGASGETIDFARTAKASPTRGGGIAKQ